MGVRYLTEGGVPGAEIGSAADAAQRAPGQERDTVPGAVGELGLAAAEGRRELVLHAGQVALAEHPAGDVNLLDARVGDSGHPDLPRAEQLLQCADGLLI